MKRPQAFAGVVMVLILATGGCALSPQTVDVQPTITTTPGNIGNGRSIVLKVRDQRPHGEFGSRGGVYGDTSTIGPAGDPTVGVHKAVAEALVTRGFKVDADGTAPLRMEIIIEDISYQTTGQPVVTRLEISARVKAVIDKGSEQYSGNAQVTQAQDVIKVPDAVENSALINDAVSKALEKLLSKAELIDFLR